MGKDRSICNSIILRDDFPSDNNRSLDSDRDGEDDSVDEDDDNDGYKDIFEEFEVVDETAATFLRLVPTKIVVGQALERAGKVIDYDRVPDLVEIYGLTISNTIIYPAGTDLNDVNSDGDWAWDGWDDWPLDPNIQHDKDHDKLEDEWCQARTLPYLADTDGDGVTDGKDDFPTKNWNTEPGKFSETKDTDKDGLSDEYEMANSNIYDYTKADTDGDGFWDCE